MKTNKSQKQLIKNQLLKQFKAELEQFLSVIDATKADLTVKTLNHNGKSKGNVTFQINWLD